MSRSLVLAGGGMRVAWQTGVVQALTEHGLTFDHVDGTSGGILTAAMLLSGQQPQEMARRWSDLPVRDFTSPLPLRDYLRGPWSLPALGDADGVLGKVFPHLGIDCDTIRRSPTQGTFNVVDFVTKQCVAVPHTDVDPELLAAGMSLPLVMTPLRRGRRVWTDAVWVKDANVTEALRRGSEELWLVWCIGNSPYWGDGPLEQYVHMIEMSANGALFAELDAAHAAGRTFRLHVVRPSHPLPLDTELYSGRISADTLVAFGYRDAWEYLDGMSPAGLDQDPSCTAMTEPPPGVRVTERLRGRLDGEELTLHLVTELPAKVSGKPMRVAGHADHRPWGGRVWLADGRLSVHGSALSYRARLRVDGRWMDLAARRDLHDDAGLDAWRDGTTVHVSLDGGATTTLRLGVLDAARALASVEPVGTHGPAERADALARVVRGGLSRVLATYGAESEGEVR
jgi:predicted acylesterase/phospholipase RssA